jgi:hypothetical protein
MFTMLIAWITGSREAPAALFAVRTSNEITTKVSHVDIFTLTPILLY